MKSLLLKIKIQIERQFDQMHRRLIGLPTLKRMMITPQLFLGGQYNLRGFHKLRDLGMTAIVNMRTSSYHQAAIEEHLQYLHLPTVDHTAPKLEDLRKGVQFIDTQIKKGGKVYIHCKAGEGRGPSMVIAYLISQGMTLDDALDQIKAIRTFVKPNRIQTERLREFEKLIVDNRPK